MLHFKWFICMCVYGIVWICLTLNSMIRVCVQLCEMYICCFYYYCYSGSNWISSALKACTHTYTPTHNKYPPMLHQSTFSHLTTHSCTIDIYSTSLSVVQWSNCNFFIHRRTNGTKNGYTQFQSKRIYLDAFSFLRIYAKTIFGSIDLYAKWKNVYTQETYKYLCL